MRDAGHSGIRAAQVSSRLVRLLQERLARGLGDPRYKGMVSILGAEIDDRSGQATIRVSVLPGERGTLTVAAMQSAAARLRADLQGPMRIRRMPALHFVLDDSLKQMAAIGTAVIQSDDLAIATRDGAESEPESRS
ncbi:MAG: ribosome-binding factor A [Planctomycetota bacterium]|nr:ribosome-binding factor A [Planctomycetota bacterium]MDA1106530.1 ribosome-binding factor A [Planctomycetota bacterium]